MVELQMVFIISFFILFCISSSTFVSEYCYYIQGKQTKPYKAISYAWKFFFSKEAEVLWQKRKLKESLMSCSLLEKLGLHFSLPCLVTIYLETEDLCKSIQKKLIDIALYRSKTIPDYWCKFPPSVTLQITG